MEDAIKLNVNPSTVQNAGTAGELKNHVGVNVTESPVVTNAAKLPLALNTVGFTQLVTSVAVLTLGWSNVTPPAKVIAPVTATVTGTA
jgi:hypothetical protein